MGIFFLNSNIVPKCRLHPLDPMRHFISSWLFEWSPVFHITKLPDFLTTVMKKYKKGSLKY